MESLPKKREGLGSISGTLGLKQSVIKGFPKSMWNLEYMDQGRAVL